MNSNDKDYLIHLPVFDGPFDLLLHLIRENQVDIYDIPIAQITDQYLAYLSAMEEMDLDIASSFLIMAATLLSIKAKMLLPSVANEDEEIEDAREELVHDLLEYMRFKEAAQSMAALHEASTKRIARPNEEDLYVHMFSRANPLDGKTLDDLQKAFWSVLNRAHKESDMVLSIEREHITLRDKLDELYALISSAHQVVFFSRIFDSCRSRMEMIVAFLALLELVRQKVIVAEQSENYGEIYLYAGELENYDRDAAI